MVKWWRGLIVVAVILLLFFGFWLPNADGPGPESTETVTSPAAAPDVEPLPTLAELGPDCGEPLPPRLAPDMLAHVTRPEEGDGVVRGLRLRIRPGDPAVRLLAPGAPITITGDAVCADGQRWWPVTSAEGIDGWVNEVDAEDVVYLITPGE